MLRRFFPITSLIKGCLSWIFGAIFAALLELIFPVAVNRVIDDLSPSGNWKWILYACLGLLGIYVVSSFFHYVVTYWGINSASTLRRICAKTV